MFRFGAFCLFFVEHSSFFFTAALGQRFFFEAGERVWHAQRMCLGCYVFKWKKSGFHPLLTDLRPDKEKGQKWKFGAAVS